jgi:hypothetical protein
MNLTQERERAWVVRKSPLRNSARQRTFTLTASDLRRSHNRTRQGVRHEIAAT